MIDPKLQGKVAIVTGANHGIGAATAKALAKQGVKVLLHYFRLPPDPTSTVTKTLQQNRAQTADAIVKAITKDGGTAQAFEGHLANIQLIPQLFDHAQSHFGPVQIIVNNAAVCLPDTFHSNTITQEEKTGQETSTLTPASLQAHFDVNTKTTALIMAEYAKRFIAKQLKWGRIINVSTDWADCFPTEVSYGASKAAMESYSRSAAVELGKYGITVNIVAPGPIQTGWMTPKVETLQAKSSPLCRIGTPEDVADVITFLASHQARWLTGQRLFVGGGNRII